MFEAVEISREITGSGQNLLLCGDAYQQQPALSALAGQVQAVYIDPPFMTGETFTRRRDLLSRRVFARNQRRGVARRSVQDDKGDESDHHQDRDRRDQPSYEK